MSYNRQYSQYPISNSSYSNNSYKSLNTNSATVLNDRFNFSKTNLNYLGSTMSNSHSALKYQNFISSTSKTNNIVSSSNLSIPFKHTTINTNKTTNSFNQFTKNIAEKHLTNVLNSLPDNIPDVTNLNDKIKITAQSKKIENLLEQYIGKKISKNENQETIENASSVSDSWAHSYLKQRKQKIDNKTELNDLSSINPKLRKNLKDDSLLVKQNSFSDDMIKPSTSVSSKSNTIDKNNSENKKSFYERLITAHQVVDDLLSKRRINNKDKKKCLKSYKWDSILEKDKEEPKINNKLNSYFHRQYSVSSSSSDENDSGLSADHDSISDEENDETEQENTISSVKYFQQTSFTSLEIKKVNCSNKFNNIEKNYNIEKFITFNYAIEKNSLTVQSSSYKTISIYKKLKNKQICIIKTVSYLHTIFNNQHASLNVNLEKEQIIPILIHASFSNKKSLKHNICKIINIICTLKCEKQIKMMPKKQKIKKSKTNVLFKFLNQKQSCKKTIKVKNYKKIELRIKEQKPILKTTKLNISFKALKIKLQFAQHIISIRKQFAKTSRFIKQKVSYKKKKEKNDNKTKNIKCLKKMQLGKEFKSNAEKINTNTSVESMKEVFSKKKNIELIRKIRGNLRRVSLKKNIKETKDNEKITLKILTLRETEQKKRNKEKNLKIDNEIIMNNDNDAHNISKLNSNKLKINKVMPNIEKHNHTSRLQDSLNILQKQTEPLTYANKTSDKNINTDGLSNIKNQMSSISRSSSCIIFPSTSAINDANNKNDNESSTSSLNRSNSEISLLQLIHYTYRRQTKWELNHLFSEKADLKLIEEFRRCLQIPWPDAIIRPIFCYKCCFSNQIDLKLPSTVYFLNRQLPNFLKQIDYKSERDQVLQQKNLLKNVKPSHNVKIPLKNKSILNPFYGINLKKVNNKRRRGQPITMFKKKRSFIPKWRRVNK